jgi:DNA-directed RNA polymerase subunit RPC12/RpoP
MINKEDIQDEKLLKDTMNWFDNHDSIENIRCAHCGSDDVFGRSESSYHNHGIHGMHLDEIYECGTCGKYTKTVWKLAKVVALNEG